MLRPRIIPCLLVHGAGLVKTVGFASPKYVGDPLNAVRIFNEKEVDELMVLDIDATARQREPDYARIRALAAECRMPLCYGGSMKSVEQVGENRRPRRGESGDQLGRRRRSRSSWRAWRMSSAARAWWSCWMCAGQQPASMKSIHTTIGTRNTRKRPCRICRASGKPRGR